MTDQKSRATPKLTVRPNRRAALILGGLLIAGCWSRRA